MINKFDRALKRTISMPNKVEAKIGFRVNRVVNPANDADYKYFITLQDISKAEAIRKEKERLRLLQFGVGKELMPSILHELKNPLAAITTTIEVLLEELPEGKFQNEISAVLSELRRMKLTFEGVGLIGQEIHSTRKGAPLKTALKDACQVMSARLKQARLRSTCNIEPIPLLAFNAGMIRALVFNIITNSMHACSKGDLISFEAKMVDQTLELRVSDSGKGMTPETLKRCTEMFYTTRSSGSGIGLALCKKAVETAHGQFLIESKKGEGTVVTVHLPTDVGPEL